MDEDNIIEEIAEVAVESADELVIKEFTEVNKEDADALIAQTQFFLENVEGIYGKILSYNDLQKQVKNIKDRIKKLSETKKAEKINAKEIADLNNDIAQIKIEQLKEDEFKLFISQFEKFQRVINSYFGIEVKTVFLYNDSNTGEIGLYEVVGDIGELVDQSYSSSDYSMTARFKSNIDFSSSVLKKMETSQLGLEVLDNTYKEVLRRADISKKYIKKKSTIIILWNPDGVWRKMEVKGGYGDLSEGYLYFAFNKQKRDLFTKILEQDVGVFMENGVASVDQIAGWLKGDVAAPDLGEITQIAAKTKGASLGGYKQLMNMALMIKDNPQGFIDKINSAYKRMLNNESKGVGKRNKSRRLGKHMSQTYTDMINEIKIS